MFPLCGSEYVLPLHWAAVQCRYSAGHTHTQRVITDIITFIQYTTSLVPTLPIKPNHPHRQLKRKHTGIKTERCIPPTLLTCSFGSPAKKGVMQLSPLGLSQGLVYTIPNITQQVWSTYTTNTPTITVVKDDFRNMMLVSSSRCVVSPRLAEGQGHMSANEES